jgi:hypothetical protein
VKVTKLFKTTKSSSFEEIDFSNKQSDHFSSCNSKCAILHSLFNYSPGIGMKASTSDVQENYSVINEQVDKLEGETKRIVKIRKHIKSTEEYKTNSNEKGSLEIYCRYRNIL